MNTTTTTKKYIPTYLIFKVRNISCSLCIMNKFKNNSSLLLLKSQIHPSSKHTKELKCKPNFKMDYNNFNNTIQYRGCNIT